MQGNGNCVWASCPYCSMQFLNLAADQITAHVHACAMEAQQEMHPEVADLDKLVEEHERVKQLEMGLEDIIHPKKEKE